MYFVELTDAITKDVVRVNPTSIKLYEPAPHGSDVYLKGFKECYHVSELPGTIDDMVEHVIRMRNDQGYRHQSYLEERLKNYTSEIVQK